MNTVYLWQAGSTEGVVVADRRRARSRAAACMRETNVAEAVVETHYYTDAIRVRPDGVTGGYIRAEGPHWTGRLYPGGRVFWKRRPQAPALTAV